jgi:glycerophosphoryl diester phosphodiesterase
LLFFSKRSDSVLFKKKEPKHFYFPLHGIAVSRPFELHGHRGARGLWPENTIPGFAGALALGVSAIEMDAALPAEGVVVLSHDPTLDPSLTRGPDGNWIDAPGPWLRDLDAATVRGFDVGRIRPGTARASAFPAQQAMEGVRLPRLDEVVSLDPDVMLAIELKTFPDHPERTPPPEALADAVLAVLDQAGATARARILSFDWRGLRYLRRLRPELSLGYLTEAETLAAARLWWDGPAPEDFDGSVPRAVAAEGGTVWGPDLATLTRPEAEEAQSLGVLVNPWTVNEPEDIRRMIDWGIGALTTDYPDRVQAVLESV